MRASDDEKLEWEYFFAVMRLMAFKSEWKSNFLVEVKENLFIFRLSFQSHFLARFKGVLPTGKWAWKEDEKEEKNTIKK